MELFGRSVEQSPLISAAYGNLGRVCHRAGRLGETEAATRKAMELSPRRAALHATLALILLAAGRVPEALTEANQEADSAIRHWWQAIVHHGKGDQAESAAAMAELIEKYASDSAFQVAEVHGFRQELDEAFDWLERAYRQRDGGLSEMKFSPYLHSLHGDSRWTVSLRKMGLE